MDNYLETLRKLLNKYDISKEEREEIIEDYRQMIMDGKDKGLSDEEIIEKLGSPEIVYKSLRSEFYKKNPSTRKGEKFIAVSPFIALLIFFGLGFGYKLWHPGWMIFLLTPITAIFVEMFTKRKPYAFTAISPFIALIIFLLLGFMLGLWHPGWIIFLIIPIAGVIESFKEEKEPLSQWGVVLTFICFIAFVVIGYITNKYIPTWMILLIPIAYFIAVEPCMKSSSRTVKPKNYRIIALTALIVSSGLYLYLGYSVTNWRLASAAYIIFVIVAILTNYIKFEYSGKDHILFKLTAIGSIIMFLVVGYFLSAWMISWLFLLSIPMLAILLRGGSKKKTAISPFIALITFMLLGYFFSLWHIGWLIFLIIPMTAILEE